MRSSETSTTASTSRSRQVAASSGHVGRDRAGLGLARAVAGVLVGDHVQHVDDAAEVLLAADRDRDRDAARRQLLLHRLERGAEVGAVAVEVVDEDDARLLELVAAAPQPRGHDLDARHARDREERALDDAQRAERVGDEARIAGRVEDVELVALVLGVQQRARDRHRAPLLVLVVIRHRAAVGHGAQARDRARLEEQRLRERRLAASAVADERDVADLLGRERHRCLLPDLRGSGDDIALSRTAGAWNRSRPLPRPRRRRGAAQAAWSSEPCRRTRRRRMAFVCSWETRDSVTLSTSPISRSVSSS